jgi:hypothetical protein
VSSRQFLTEKDVLEYDARRFVDNVNQLGSGFELNNAFEGVLMVKWKRDARMIGKVVVTKNLPLVFHMLVSISSNVQDFGFKRDFFRKVNVRMIEKIDFADDFSREL